ncbi:hypothetical protein QCA50_010857 [Cerrena zonata]|uniref:Uncharacterized protein n=1 Tax=Cerrena zonata TaxID=2478898 RepID=A0AAW0G4F3_9APHY
MPRSPTLSTMFSLSAPSYSSLCLSGIDESTWAKSLSIRSSHPLNIKSISPSWLQGYHKRRPALFSRSCLISVDSPLAVSTPSSKPFLYEDKHTLCSPGMDWHTAYSTFPSYLMIMYRICSLDICMSLPNLFALTKSSTICITRMMPVIP